MNDNMLFEPNKKRKRHSYFRTADVVFLLIVTCIVTLNMSYIISLASDNAKTSNSSSHLNEFITEYNRIISNYYGELDEEKLVDAALDGLINALPDDYSTTISDSESNSYDTQLQGYFEGLGVEIVNDEEKNIYIYSIIEDSPAASSELKVGDKVISVNGTNVEGQETSVFVKLVQNSKSKKFELVLEREGQKITTTITKGNIVLKSVSSEVLDVEGKAYGYIRVSVFASNTDEQFESHLESLETSNINGLIIDLRGNGGGYLSAVTKMLNLFIDKSKILYQTEQNDKVTKIRSTQNNDREYPIVVLVDGGSASASEIMAAALSEQCNAKLVGKKTYGKGTVQELITLSDGNQYKYTTKKWLTPKGNWINGEGLTPDIDVDLDEEYINDPVRENDNQFSRALEELIK